MKTIISILFTALLSANVFAQDQSPDSASQTPTDGTSSIVVAETKATAPSVFVSYSYYHFDLEGRTAANTKIYAFGKSAVDFHLLTATWLYNPKWTLLTFVPYTKTMVETIYEPKGVNFKTKDYTGGLGDVRLMAVTPLSVNPLHTTMADIGVTLPTGSIDQYFTSAPNQRAAYNMQPGSGTVDLLAGATVTNTMADFVSTARGQITVRGGRNANGYNLGNEFQTKLTSFYQMHAFSAGAVANYKVREAINGRDEKYELNNAYVGTAGIAGDGHQYYHGTQANWDANAVVKFQTPPVGIVSALFEVGIPVWQGSANKDDVQLDVNYYASATLNGSF